MKYSKQKRIDAQARADARAKRSTLQQMALIKQRPGKSMRETNRLLKIK